MKNWRLRMAEITDAAAVLDIYTHYVRHTAVSFEAEVPGPAAFEERMRDSMRDYPYLVAESGGRIVGYAYSHRHMERAAYQWNVEFSVYLRADCTGRGLGRALYAALLALSGLQGMHNVYAAVTLPNAASQRLHTGMGFEPWGLMAKTGYKFGQWHDVLCYGKRIAKAGAEPAPPVRVSMLLPDAVAGILERARFEAG